MFSSYCILAYFRVLNHAGFSFNPSSKVIVPTPLSERELYAQLVFSFNQFWPIDMFDVEELNGTIRQPIEPRILN